MHRRFTPRIRAAVALVALLAACKGGGTKLPPEQPPFHVEGEALLRVAQRLDLASIHRDVVLTCPPETAPATRTPARFASCAVGTLAPDGSVTPLGITGVRSARRLSGDRLLVQRPNLDLAVRDASGAEQLVASSVAIPSVATDGQRISFVQLPAGTTEIEPGLASRIVLLDLESGKGRTVTEDPFAGSSWPVPGSEDVLFVSGRTGLASLWISSPAGERQLTNVGQTRMGKEFVPVPSDDLLWLPGTRTAVFTAHYAQDTLWTVDLDDGSARLLGPGRLPALAPDGGVVAFAPKPAGDAGGTPRVLHYLQAP